MSPFCIVKLPAGRASIEGLRPYAESLRSNRYPVAIFTDKVAGIFAVAKNRRATRRKRACAI